MRHRIGVIAGDGIGNEVVPVAMGVLDAATTAHGITIEWIEFPWSSAYYARTGEMMPSDGLDSLAELDAIFLGAIGDPSLPDHVTLWELLLPIRRTFRQYVNLRPIRLLPGIVSPLRSSAGIDFVVVRENSEGEYSEIGGRFDRHSPHEFAFQGSVFSRSGTERVLHYAFELAASRRGHLVSATKSNGIPHSMPFWDELCEAVASEYPSVEVESVHIDALAARFVLRPQTLDVVVASNLFGDILTDLGAAVAGSIGIAPSANLNPERAFPSMFEPIHGSAPDIAGRGIANPIGQIWSGAMMLEHLGHQECADEIVSAIEGVLTGGKCNTPDLGGDARTADVGRAIVDQLGANGGRP